MSTSTAHLHTPADLEAEPTLEHPDGSRESLTAMAGDPRSLSIELAGHGYALPTDLRPSDRVALAPLPDVPCPSWCMSTGTAHRAEADRLGRVHRVHVRVLLASDDTSLTITRRDALDPIEPGRPHLQLLADDLDRTDALRLAAALMDGSDLLDATQGGANR